jgi:hypothetical protein
MSDARKKKSKRALAEGLVLDTNLLLVFIVGAYDPLHVSKHKRTREKYRPEDYYNLRDQVTGYQRLVTTPHILTEVSNLLGQAPELLRPAYFKTLARMIPEFEEVHIPAAQIFSEDSSPYLGITDLGIREVARAGHLVLTVDSPLADYLQRQNINVIYYRTMK